MERRRRTSPTPTGVRPRLNDATFALFRGLDRHGPLPTPLAAKLYGGSYAHFQDRIGTLYHEAEGGGPYLIRPEGLNPHHGLNPEPAWHDLHENARTALAERDELALYSPLRTDDIFHRGAGACITVSLDLLGKARGLAYLDTEAILTHPACPPLDGTNPIAVQTAKGKLIPDALFGFQYPGKKRFFLCEWDRGTESYSRHNKLPNTLEVKFERYFDFFEKRLYEERWGIPNARLLFVTTLPGRIPFILEKLEGKRHADRFLFKAISTFGLQTWRAPRDLLTEVFTPWHTVNGPVSITEPL